MAEYTELIKALRCANRYKNFTKDCDSQNPNEPCRYCHHWLCEDDRIFEDAAAAIEDLQALYRQMDKRNTDLHNEGYDVGYWAGKRDAEAAQPHWVSVFDDLPRHNAVVVVSDGKRSWDVGQYHFLFKSDDRTIWWWKKHTTRKVLWWMYKEDALPEPPQEVQDV